MERTQETTEDINERAEVAAQVMEAEGPEDEGEATHAESTMTESMDE